MQRPNMVLRKSMRLDELNNIQNNLINLDYWPMWNQFANRILSEEHGILKDNQRIDLHRVVAQQLIEDMWIISKINKGSNPEFCQIVMNWQGQKINGRTSALAIKMLTVDITVLLSEQGGVEITAWWDITRFSRVLGIGSRITRRIVTQIFDDLTKYGVSEFNLSNSGQ